MCESWGTEAGWQYSSGTGIDPQCPYQQPSSAKKYFFKIPENNQQSILEVLYSVAYRKGINGVLAPPSIENKSPFSPRPVHAPDCLFPP